MSNLAKLATVVALLSVACTRVSMGPGLNGDAGADAAEDARIVQDVGVDVKLDGPSVDGTAVDGSSDGGALDGAAVDAAMDGASDAGSDVDVVLPPVALQFDLQPAGVYAGAPFSTQPVVSLRDAQDNVVTSATEEVTLSLVSGAGQLRGTLTATSSGGVATFSDVSYDIIESAIVLRASAAGLTVDSAPFDLAQLTPGACQNQDARFARVGGGCQDLDTSLVWSRMPAATYTWHGAIWDGRQNGAAPPDSGDYGRSNDYPPSANPCAGTCDSSPNTYCHDLFEGGQGDWRMPTHDELVILSQHLRTGPVPYLVGDTSLDIWSSTSYDGYPSRGWAVRLADGVSTNPYKNVALTVLCVRGGRSAALELVVEEAPPSLGVGVVASRTSRIDVRIRESDSGAQVNAQGVTISLQSTTPLGGTLTATTSIRGIAFLADWSVEAVGDVTIRLVADGIAPAEFTLPVGAYPHTCRLEDPSFFVTADGGCKDASTGLAWSLPAPVGLSWHDAIWDSTQPLIPPPGSRRLPDAGDDGRTNDYANDPQSVPDGSLADYCHDLVEGGFSDWRVANVAELRAAANIGQGAARYFSYPVDRRFWSSETYGNGGATARYVYLSNGSFTTTWKNQPNTAVCVRD